jgi:xylan 1,4-beta-xylosidase
MDRYSRLPDSNLNLILRINGLPEGIYEKREYTVNRLHGSSFDLWCNIGGPDSDEEVFDFLKKMSLPMYHKTKCHIREHFFIEKEMGADEICMIELKRT